MCFSAFPKAEGRGLHEDITCLNWDGLKSQMPFACPCVTWPLPHAGRQREKAALLSAGEEPSQGRGLPGTQAPMGPPGDRHQSLAHSELQQRSLSLQRREQMPARQGRQTRARSLPR